MFECSLNEWRHHAINPQLVLDVLLGYPSKTKIDFVINFIAKNLLSNELAKLVSGRHVCCWQGFRTNFSISWFKPSTELRIGLVCGIWRGGIRTGVAFAFVLEN